ncbi:MAG: class I SAM-dependent methyltransferase [Sumerlaeia bacterium]
MAAGSGIEFGGEDETLLRHPRYCDLSYRGILPGEPAFLAALLRGYSIRSAPCRLLELGAGWGRIAVPLAAEFGFSVTALDREPAMLTYLSERAGNLPLRCVQADMTRFRGEDCGGPFDAVLCPLGIANLIWVEDDFASMLTSIQAALRPGGVFIASLNAAPSPDSLGQAGATWETKAEGVRTRTEFTLLGRGELRVASHRVLVNDSSPAGGSAGIRRDLLWRARVRIVGEAFLRRMALRVAGMRLIAWHRPFDHEHALSEPNATAGFNFAVWRHEPAQRGSLPGA